MEIEIRRRTVKLTDEQKKRHAEIRSQVEADRPQGNREALMVKAQMEATFAAMRMLKAERDKRGISLDQLAERTGIGKSDLTRLENDINASPMMDTLVRIARAIGGTIEFRFHEAA